MPINLTCECGKKLAVKDDMAGKKVKCPGCAETFTAAVDAPAKKKTDDEGPGFEVVDDNEQLLGVVSIGDLNAYLSHDQEVTIHVLHEYISGRV